MFRESLYDYGLVTFNEFPVLTIYDWGPSVQGVNLFSKSENVNCS